MKVVVITGDIINSSAAAPTSYNTLFQDAVLQRYLSIDDYEYYRGDSFQIRLYDLKSVFLIVFRIKAIIKRIAGLDVRMAIGYGQETNKEKRVGTSSGSAYEYSGRMLDQLKELDRTLIFRSSKEQLDARFDIVLKLMSVFSDKWSVVSSETIVAFLGKDEVTQKEMAAHWGMKQSAVSQRLDRSQYVLLCESIEYLTKELMYDTFYKTSDSTSNWGFLAAEEPLGIIKTKK